MKSGLFMMKCGHVANARDVNGKPACVICTCFDVDHEIVNPNEGLEGRECKCGDCGSTCKSSWDLPFFKYMPQRSYDSYYCGCYGWD